MPRHASTATASIQAIANLLVYSFSPVLILVNLFYFLPCYDHFLPVSPTLIFVVVAVIVSVINDNLWL